MATPSGVRGLESGVGRIRPGKSLAESPEPRHSGRRTSPRQGFTLVELLVATAIFVIGFAAAFSLFLAAVRARTRADDLTHLSFAATSIAEEISLGPPTSFAPTSSEVVELRGPGGVQERIASDDGWTSDLYRYPAIPGIWYRVEQATDLFDREQDANTSQAEADTINPSAVARLTLFVYRDTRISGSDETIGSQTVTVLTDDDLIGINRRANLVEDLKQVPDLDLVVTDVRRSIGETNGTNGTNGTTRREALLGRLVAAGLAVRQEIIVPRH